MKSLLFRGTTRTFSNRYHFNGGTPADTAHWTTFADAVTTAEKAIYWGSGLVSQVTQAVGYAAGSDVPVFSKTYTLSTTGAFTGGLMQAGEVSALVRYATTARTTKNHPVYLFNYYHGAIAAGAAPDTLISTQKAAMDAYAAAWVAGFSDGTNTLKRAGPNGATAISGLAETFLTHRDFPR